MADERQPQSTTQANEQHQQPQAQPSSQEIQPSGRGQQTSMARRWEGLPSVFNLDPSEMLRTSPFALMRRFSEEMDHWFGQLGMGRGGPGMSSASGGRFAPPVEVFERDGTMV